MTEIPIIWLLLFGLFCLAVVVGDYFKARDRAKLREQAKKKRFEFLTSPEGVAKMREVDRVIREHQKRTGQIKE